MPFGEALSRPGLSLIAEFKRRSPSAGEISAAVQVADQVGAYERGGAAALSRSSPTRPTSAARWTTCAPPEWPAIYLILRKDFIIDPYQLYEAAVNGADAAC